MGKRILRAAALVAVVVMCACSGAGMDEEGTVDDNGPTVGPDGQVIDDSSEALGTTRADKALKWYHDRAGSTAWEHYCEKAAENSYGRSGVYASAIADWKAQGSKRHYNMNPPRGALVFWKTSIYGHVGVANGNGGFCSSSVNGHIGCAKLPYFQDYLGWAPSPF